jgi:hypothetical protein
MVAFLLGFFRMVWLFGKDHRGLSWRISLSDSNSPFTNVSTNARVLWVGIAGSGVLDHAFGTLERLAASLGRSSSGHGGALAARAVPSVLEPAFKETWKDRIMLRTESNT